ncbi:hypothetical protein O181_080834 [Austropuccinia psidii MF-1]|uniref:Uncharacterized protein n=1 Tax=Austropuccinia psidii MF-1 TaxID=1389203 RepID=A0A9Q3IJJ3_9BASI|nr:hypothetical protein [Austropuccinia psidii MF-1]
MEDARTLTSSQRDISVSVKELVYGGKAAGVGTSAKSLDRPNELLSSSEEVHGPRKDRGTSEGLDTHVLQGTSPTDKSFVEKSKNFIRGLEEEVGPRKGQKPNGSSPSLQKKKSTSTSAKQGQEKGKGKGKIQVEQALPTELQNSQKGEDSQGQCVQYGKNSDGIQKQGGGKIEPMFSKDIDILNLVTGFETCNKEILAKLNNFEYIQQKSGREILQSKVTLLNQPEDNSVSLIIRQLKELRIQFQNLENSNGHNAALFQELLEKSDKERLELKGDIQSSIKNISLKNELPRQSTPIVDRNVLT